MGKAVPRSEMSKADYSSEEASDNTDRRTRSRCLIHVCTFGGNGNSCSLLQLSRLASAYSSSVQTTPTRDERHTCWERIRDMPLQNSVIDELKRLGAEHGLRYEEATNCG